MWLEENIDENSPLMKRVEFVTLQSCEKRDTEVHYKNVSRKYLVLDLNDGKLMSEVGKTVDPFGFEEHIHDKFADSFFLARVWAEKGLAERGRRHIRSLYRKYPEKFFDVTFGKSLEPVKCSYIIDEMTSQKRVCVKEDETKGLLAPMDEYINKIKAYEEVIKQQQHLIAQVTSENKDEPRPYLIIEEKTGTI